jgi:A/G-specific adenine glycosylase
VANIGYNNEIQKVNSLKFNQLNLVLLRFIKKAMNFSKLLIYWYLQNKRNLPWRATDDPYKIWLSEIILQQTRVVQGISYYNKFVENFPTIFDLAKADEEQVLKLWQGLGYYSRARNLHHSAKLVVNKLNGIFPSTYDQLIKLKGIGDYTASAIASICFNEPTAVVDGNVYRVLARHFAIATPINSTVGAKEFKSLAQQLIDKESPGTHNQALMELGATVCKPQNPDCPSCPLKSDCLAYSSNKINMLPVKEQKLKITKKYFNYVVVHSKNDKTLWVKRNRGIWQNLYEFPLIESSGPLNENQLMKHQKFEELFDGLDIRIQLFESDGRPHKLTHQHIYAKFWILEVKEDINEGIFWNTIEKYPVPVLIDNFLSLYKMNPIF